MMNILEFIPTGINNAVSMADLAVITRTDLRTVRRMVHNARKNGAVICSTCDNDSGGYYIPRDVAEAVPYYKRKHDVCAVAPKGRHGRRPTEGNRQQLSRINSATEALQSVIDFIGTHDVK